MVSTVVMLPSTSPHKKRHFVLFGLPYGKRLWWLLLNRKVLQTLQCRSLHGKKRLRFMNSAQTDLRKATQLCYKENLNFSI
ncbi:hypothetical protein Y1Q_0011056 [Alligator mississippiensis]|uniref:Uncharacterized protein n=1 Tax=Alligator mississippiensis TaxID=8496 RepID=A0A151NXQ9_ALLMI|nr:hypothetical protein Y1Q_0011056 [Alligator mississippiensis]